MSNLTNILYSRAKDLKPVHMGVCYGMSDKVLFRLIGARRGKAYRKAFNLSCDIIGHTDKRGRNYYIQSPNVIHALDTLRSNTNL